MRIPSILIAFLHLGTIAAQVRIDKPLVLTGGDADQRQVLSLDPAQEPGDALDAAAEQRGLAHWTGDATGNAWSIDMPVISGAPAAGLSIVLRKASDSMGDVSLTVNGYGPYPVLLAPGVALQAQDYPTGSMIAMAFDGTSFHVTNGVSHGRRNCPSGMVGVGEHYCIDSLQQIDAGSFFAGAVDCVQSGKRLCTWSEWQQACLRRNALGLVGMIGDWEWTNSAANEDQGVRMVGNISCTAVGVRASSDTTLYHRCCYTR